GAVYKISGTALGDPITGTYDAETRTLTFHRMFNGKATQFWRGSLSENWVENRQVLRYTLTGTLEPLCPDGGLPGSYPWSAEKTIQLRGPAPKDANRSSP